MADQARTIRIPVNVVEVINTLGRIQRELLQSLGREPTPEHLAREMDITAAKVLEIQQYARQPISLDRTIGDEGGGAQLGDFIADSEAVSADDLVSFTLLQDHLRVVLGTLSDREAGIVRLRFGLTDGQARTLDEIGHVYGVTRERIRQIESKTMSKLRHPPAPRHSVTTSADTPDAPGGTQPMVNDLVRTAPVPDGVARRSARSISPPRARRRSVRATTGSKCTPVGPLADVVTIGILPATTHQPARGSVIIQDVIDGTSAVGSLVTSGADR